MVNDTRDIQYSFLLRSAIAENAQIVLHMPPCLMFPISDLRYISYGYNIEIIKERLIREAQ
jgi:hypothetical protein